MGVDGGGGDGAMLAFGKGAKRSCKHNIVVLVVFFSLFDSLPLNKKKRMPPLVPVLISAISCRPQQKQVSGVATGLSPVTFHF